MYQQESPMRLQIFNLWEMCSSPEEVLNFLAPSVLCPHLKMNIANETFSVYLDIKNKLEEEREQERERKNRLPGKHKLQAPAPFKRGIA